ncbi:MAG: bifunctional (p)ppGpp synthetase/guanosine-3',5'-bis(diphosphate) 3'-pyrophosphohydrolase [Alphaproteobacteria bacterium]|nr:bifunctional (p)ppGpp synthetase/guanosine-3',5'-bis(diphosphate) 3'-pyrophosphohydrolase [Alphaproteobacteria bacterium]
MLRQYELVEKVKAFDPGVDEGILNRAYVYAVKAHGAQKRASGDPYFSHPIEVAGILADMKLDVSSIVSGLLHDTIEDTGTTLDEIERLFGREVRRIVDGVTKLSKIRFESQAQQQAENFRKFLLAMSEDIRVLLIKLADRLHNMRTLHFIASPEKRQRIAKETMEIFAPLAERIGLHWMQIELEDLAFAELNGEARGSIIRRLDFLRENAGDLVARISAELTRTLAAAGIQAQVSGREKRPYSIWQKMEHKSIEFGQLSDIVAFRIAVADVPACYAALGAVHAAYRMVPGRFKDYISTPKKNGYRSLHTGVIGPENQRIEIQIRTREMHAFAEHGVAAHWAYKQKGGVVNPADGSRYRWIRELLEILESASGPEEFLENTKLEMFRDQVFCFTPKGDLIALPQGATPIDFAYAVHSQIGDTCVGAKVNGRLVPLRTILKNGDQVDVVVSKASVPSPSWETFVVTGKARNRVRRFIRLQERVQHVNLGRAIAEKVCKDHGSRFTDRRLAAAAEVLEIDGVEDLYCQLGQGTLPVRRVAETLFPGDVADDDEGDHVAAFAGQGGPGSHPVAIRGLVPGLAVHMAPCCQPLPGERIVGVIEKGRGITIHAIDCETLDSHADEPESWIDVSWDPQSDLSGQHVGRVRLVLTNRPGSLSSMSTVIARNHGNITNLKITNRSADFFEMAIDLEVEDIRHLTNIITALRAEPAVNSVERARG